MNELWVKVNEGTNKSNTAIIYSSMPNQEEDMDEAFPKQMGKSCLWSQAVKLWTPFHNSETVAYVGLD